MAKRAEKRTRAEAAEETRAALLEAGAALFGAQGLDGPSLDAICAKAGYTRGAFYVHFRDRDDFLEAVMARVGARFLESVMGGATLEETVQRFLEAMASGDYPLTRKGGVRPHQLLDACARSAKIRKRYVKLVGETLTRLDAQLRGAQARGAVRADVEADQTGVLLLAAVIGAQTMIELELPIEPARVAVALMTMLQPKG